MKWSRSARTDFGVGIFKVPFGREVPEYDPDWPFIERSWAATNMFPGEPDTGARATTKVGLLTGEVAVVNGQMLGERTFAVLPDLNKGKDLVLHLTYDVFHLFEVGASGYYGQGQTVDGTLLRFKEFPRFAYGFQIAARHALAPALGETRVIAELVRGQNMDRGDYSRLRASRHPGRHPRRASRTSTSSGCTSGSSSSSRATSRSASATTSTRRTRRRRTTSATRPGVVGVVHLSRGLSAQRRRVRARHRQHPPPPAPRRPHATSTPSRASFKCASDARARRPPPRSSGS